jgi:hypothetical protein
MSWGARAGGAAAIGGGMAAQGYFGNKASKKASRAAAAAAEEMRRSKQEAIGYLAPYRQSGNLALSPLTGLLTGNQYDPNTGQTTAINSEQQEALFQKSPGYQFRIDQAMKNVQASQAAKGGLLSGGAMKELSDYGSGMASSEYGNYINQLMGLSGMGERAATNSGNFAIGAGAQIADYTQEQGMAMANRDAQLGNTIGGGLSDVGGLAMMFGAKKALKEKPPSNDSGVKY